MKTIKYEPGRQYISVDIAFKSLKIKFAWKARKRKIILKARYKKTLNILLNVTSRQFDSKLMKTFRLSIITSNYMKFRFHKRSLVE